jgi:predicted nucleotidyltransferase
METTVNKMSDYASVFFNKLSNYLDTKIYFYGSIQRVDYFPQSSDIDVDIFTDNEQSTMTKLQSFLNIERYNFKKFVYKLHKTNILVHGHKVKYTNKENYFSTEISIYNEKNKENVLNEHNSKIKLPFYISVILIILKTFYYNLGILPKNVFLNIKKFLMNYLVEGEDVEFIIL